MGMVEVIMKRCGITESLRRKAIWGRTAKAVGVHVKIKAMVYLQMIQRIGANSLRAALCLNGASEDHLGVDVILM
jgi:hypothetical protein